ncbi:efflux RND transporter permease subunit [Hymenobacter antarcticus]|uniref:SSD domain-containing protein n=1 Tax=Hymenobacter antarcticus TaxID=486270 RepID=A0ABP7NZR0_9BACT
MAFLYKIRLLLLALTGVACVVLWPGVQAALVVDNNLSAWFLTDDPALAAYRDFQGRFGNDEVVVVVVKDDRTVLTPGYFAGLRALSAELAGLPEVAQVLGAGTTELPGRGGLLGAEAPRALLPPGATAGTVRAALGELPTLRGQLFSPDYRATRLLVVLRQLPDFDNRRGAILGRVRAVVYRHFAPGQALLGGVGVVFAGLNELSQHDFGLFLGVGYLLMFTIFLVIYRNFYLLLYTLGIVGLATYLTLGVYGALGHRINLLTVLLPIVIILLGFLDSMHVVNERNLLPTAATDTPRASALQALRNVFQPCLFTMTTTAAGFLALLTSPMAILRDFGLFAALGIALCLGLTFLLGVTILPLTRPVPRATRATGGAVLRLYELVLRHRRAFAALAVGLMLALLAGLPRLHSDTYTLGYLPDDYVVVTDHRAMEAAWGPYMPLELLVQPRPGLTLDSSRVLRAAVAFADSVQTMPGAGAGFGFQSLYLAALEPRFGPKARRALHSQGVVRAVHAQLRASYPALARQYVHEPSQTGRITVAGPMLSARQLTARMATVLGIARATLGPVARVTPAGYQPMYARITAYVTTSQTNSLLTSFGLVFLLTWAFIRNFRLAVLAVVPNLFPVLVLLGVMGWAGIALDAATASIAAIVLSLCTDDSIHFIHAYQQGRLRGELPAVARRATVAHIGPTVVLTSVILFLGYAVMLLASLKTVQLFGALTAVAIVGALFGELVIFPLVLERFDRRARL